MRSTIGIAALAFALASGAAFAQADKKTERTWKAKCSSCHGVDGKGETDQGKKMKVKDMTTAAWQKEVTDERMKKSMLEGINAEKDGVKQEMESFKDTLKPEQIDALVTHMRSFAKK